MQGVPHKQKGPASYSSLKNRGKQNSQNVKDIIEDATLKSTQNFKVTYQWSFHKRNQINNGESFQLIGILRSNFKKEILKI